MGCLCAEGTRDAHHERHTEDTGAETGNGTKRGRSGGRRSVRAITQSGVARRNPAKRFVQCVLLALYLKDDPAARAYLESDALVAFSGGKAALERK